ncbi:tyrosinase-like [Hyperolius riggenbachi]|uniref:tyrosinase-like n=1 Tax=Hyperolius riggenbachi TaxID=752182 RepID=UPI0035A2F69A
MIPIFAFLFLCYNVVQGQFPRTCVTEEALEAKTCCPVWKDRSPCGALSGRGRCRPSVPVMTLQHAFVQRRQDNDDRLDWPRHYFTSTCECFRNYSGHNCGDCKYGYFGKKCDHKKTVERKEIRQLSYLDRKRFFGYLALAKTTKSQDFVILTTGNRHDRNTYRFVDASVYDLFTWMHYYSTQSILEDGVFSDDRNYAHQGPAFPGWHRLCLLFLERQIQLLTGDEDFVIPYYDWRGELNCSICTNDFMGANDDQGAMGKYSHFASWKSICSGYDYEDAYCLSAADECQMEILHRKPGANPSARKPPTFQDVEDTLKWRKFDTPPYDITSRYSFRNALEGFMRPSDGTTRERNMHNLVHVFLGGTMSQVPISSNDPMFLLHHCFVDKIFEEWLRRHNATVDSYPDNDVPGQGATECSTPYFPCYRNKDLLNRSYKFGYTFSTYKRM